MSSVGFRPGRALIAGFVLLIALIAAVLWQLEIDDRVGGVEAAQRKAQTALSAATDAAADAKRAASEALDAQATADRNLAFLRGERGIPGVPGTIGQLGQRGAQGLPGIAIDGQAGKDGGTGRTGADSTVPGPAGADSTVAGPQGEPGPGPTMQEITDAVAAYFDTAAGEQQILDVINGANCTAPPPDFIVTCP